MKSVELALSMCDIVDIYGFTVDPGYTEWFVWFLLDTLLLFVGIIISKQVTCLYSCLSM